MIYSTYVMYNPISVADSGGRQALNASEICKDT